MKKRVDTRATWRGRWKRDTHFDVKLQMARISVEGSREKYRACNGAARGLRYSLLSLLSGLESRAAQRQSYIFMERKNRVAFAR